LSDGDYISGQGELRIAIDSGQNVP
jgi:hypothetical protein